VEVLERLSQKFELGIFTASQEQYGNAVLKVLDPDCKFFSFRLFRQHCFEMHSRVNHVKDLRILKNRDLSKVILIDNNPQAYLFQKNNAVPIIPFFNDANDNELLKLEIFLDKISDAKDVRPILRDYFKLDQYHTYKNMFRLVKELY
jgi:CTD small phosphatase-like protein 2